MEEGFKLPASSYEELARVIRAYGRLSEPASLDDVKKVSGIHTTITSGNNGFLIGIGILEGGQKKSLTDKGRALAQALEHDIADEIAKQWRELVASNDFCKKILSAVAVRRGMELSTLQAHVAYSAGQPKKGSVMTGARAVVDILWVAGLLKEEEGKFVAVPAEAAVAPQTEDSVSISKPGAGGWRLPPQAAPTVQPGTVSGLSLTIQLQIQCTPDELDALGPKLRALVKEVTRPSEADDASPGNG